MKKIISLAAVIILVAACKKDSVPDPGIDKSSTQAVVADVNDPSTYTYVIIGTQKWMKKNLDVTHYRNGDRIPQVISSAKWIALTTGAWCWYKNDSATYAATYGRLYNWYAVNDPRGLAPTGWHVPSHPEWDTLNQYLGFYGGGKLKDTGTIEAGTGLWYAPNRAANNKTGFTALPGGSRSYLDGGYYGIGGRGDWWSSTGYDTNSSYGSEMYSYQGQLEVNSHYSNNDGLSVRCVKNK